jgi:serine protease Do
MRVFNHRLFANSFLAAALVLIPLPAKGTDFGRACSMDLNSTVRIFCTTTTPNKSSFGAGAVIGKDGTILTCAHVIKDAVQIQVIEGDFNNGATHTATVLKKDEKLDLALLKVDASVHMRPIPMSQAPTPAPGTPVAAIGAPMKIMRTVTAGIVSYAGPENGMDIVIFDAKTTHGNSGGPLIDEEGDLVGIVTGDIGRDEESRLSRAVYLTEIQKFLSTSQRGFLGISTEPAKSGMSGFNMNEGLKVTRLSTQSELQPGDIIMTLMDYPVSRHADLIRMVRSLNPGEKVEMGVLRNGEFKILHLTVLEVPNR